jgi:hypothetical protein
MATQLTTPSFRIAIPPLENADHRSASGLLRGHEAMP